MASIHRSREGVLVLVLAAAAGLRIFLFASAFPFFTNVDEHRHVDAVLKYARGYLPRPGTDAYEPEIARWIALYGSPEYHASAARVARNGIPPPGWKRPAAAREKRIAATAAAFAGRPNLEAYQPPVYYLLAAAWWKLGHALGLGDGRLLYWLRQLNALFGAALVLVSYHFLAGLYPERPLMRLGVPVLLVVFPLDVFYYVTRDALPPLLLALGFFLSLRIARDPACGRASYAGAGLAAAAAFLCKYNTVVLFGVYACVSARVLLQRAEPDARRAAYARLALLWALAALPVGCWLVRNQLLFGSLTATALKVERLGWERRNPFTSFDHPLFTPSGIARFTAELVPMFWRGEIVWHREILASRLADGFYLVTSLACVALAGLGLRRPSETRFAEGMALATVLGSVALLAFLSLLFEFGATTNPSRAEPYFVQGRLISGAVVPFLMLLVRGVEEAANGLPARLAQRAAWAFVLAIAVVAAVSELRLTAPVFRSPYNWFHLP